MFYIFPQVIKPNVCEEIIQECLKEDLQTATVIKNGNKSNYDSKLRKTSVSFITKPENQATKIAWHFLREANKLCFNYDLKFFQPVQFAEYKDGGFYGWHQDSEGVSKDNEIRKLSLSLILSNPDKFTGGELQLFNGNIEDEKLKKDLNCQGTVIVFDSQDWHQVTPVTNGVRYSVVCWTLGPNFK